MHSCSSHSLGVRGVTKVLHHTYIDTILTVCDYEEKTADWYRYYASPTQLPFPISPLPPPTPSPPLLTHNAHLFPGFRLVRPTHSNLPQSVHAFVQYPLPPLPLHEVDRHLVQCLGPRGFGGDFWVEVVIWVRKIPEEGDAVGGVRVLGGPGVLREGEDMAVIGAGNGASGECCEVVGVGTGGWEAGAS